MKISPTKIVRAYMTLHGMGHKTMFSDRTNFGRSIKVWGFNDSHYRACADYLQNLGFGVKIVNTPEGRTRLWVGAPD